MQNVHKDIDKLNLVSMIVNEFVGDSDGRKFNFEKLSPFDNRSSFSSETKSTQTSVIISKLTSSVVWPWGGYGGNFPPLFVERWSSKCLENRREKSWA